MENVRRDENRESSLHRGLDEIGLQEGEFHMRSYYMQRRTAEHMGGSEIIQCFLKRDTSCSNKFPRVHY